LTLDKADFLKWSRKYDKETGIWRQKEAELSAKLQKNKMLTPDDLVQIVEWQFKDHDAKKSKVLEAVSKNDPENLGRISSQVFNVAVAEDAYRMRSLTMLNGVSPVLASVILAFFDPKRYGVFNKHAYCALLGNEPPNLFTTQNYLRFLAALRKLACKHNLDARTIEKALVAKSLNKS
jgi:hypothetical protein